MIRQPPRPTLFPSPPLFRSVPPPPPLPLLPPLLEPGREAGRPRLRALRVRRTLRAGAEGARLRLLRADRSEEHTSELQSRQYLVCRLLLEKKKKKTSHYESM